jgi:hypothetical protein
VLKLARPVSIVLAGLLSAAGVIAVLGSARPAVAAPASGSYHPSGPTRILDTRTGLGFRAGPVGASGEAVLTVAGLASVPATASAVVLNVTVTAPKGSGYLTVYPDDGSPRPVTSNLNFVPAQTVPTMVVIKVPSDDKVRVYNGSGGSVQLVADVSGYYTGASAPSGQGAFGVVSPSRLLDTRSGVGAPPAAVAAAGSAAFTVTGNGVPPGVCAVVLNVTVTAPQSAGYLTAYPHGGPIPSASNLNFLGQQTVSNLVVVPVGSDGKVTLTNFSAGTVHLLADISGYFLAGDPVNAGALGALAPVRLLDTRSGLGGSKIAVPAFQARTLSVAGRGGVPLSGASALVMNVTVTAPTGTGYLTVYGVPSRPAVSNLNFLKGQTVANLVLTQVSAGGTVTIFNGSAGTVQILADVSGYVLGVEAPLPSTSTSHYVRNVTGTGSDAAIMAAEGCADAQGGSRFVLMDIGAQSNANVPPSGNGTVLSAGSPGVRLTTSTSAVRLTYPQLTTVLNAYTQGVADCTSATVTVAVGTNSSGVSAAYPAAAKGADWASEVLNQLTAHPQVILAGANDIEASFGDSAGNAAIWEASYLAATAHDLVYTGSADNCPATFGSSADCGSAVGQSGPAWTRANYASLAHGLWPARITALPQIYYGSQAVQWANINATAVATGVPIVFAGMLTENAAACGPDCDMAPGQGWAALYHGLSTTITSPIIPVVTDLRVDS